MNHQARNPGLTHLHDPLARISVRRDDLFYSCKTPHVIDGPNRGCDQPGKSEQRTDSDEYANKPKIEVIRFTLFQFVLRAVNDTSGDVLVEIKQHDSQQRPAPERQTSPKREHLADRPARGRPLVVPNVSGAGNVSRRTSWNSTATTVMTANAIAGPKSARNSRILGRK